MLFMRVYAIWHSNKMVLGLLGVILLVSYIIFNIDARILVLILNEYQAAFTGVFYVAEIDTASVTAGSGLMHIPQSSLLM